MQQVKQHLMLLAEDPCHFVTEVEQATAAGGGARKHERWTVDFRSLVRTLRQHELENIVRERFGGVALRLMRILVEKGKLEEKQIINLALVRQREIRVTLTAMHEAGYLELQEVPRDNTRTPPRTIYLRYFHADRCRQLVLEDMYKTMARLLQRSGCERARLGPLLDKAERTDVKGNEARYLTEPERQALQAWRSKEERLLVQLTRLDRLVGVFRDY